MTVPTELFAQIDQELDARYTDWKTAYDQLPHDEDDPTNAQVLAEAKESWSQQVDDIFKSHGFTCIDAASNGDCLFNCLTMYYTLTDTAPPDGRPDASNVTLREVIVNYVLDKWLNHQPSIEPFVMHMPEYRDNFVAALQQHYQPGQWTSGIAEVIYNFIAEPLNRPVVTWSASTERPLTAPGHGIPKHRISPVSMTPAQFIQYNPTTDVIYLLHHAISSLHYKLLIPHQIFVQLKQMAAYITRVNQSLTQFANIAPNYSNSPRVALGPAYLVPVLTGNDRTNSGHSASTRSIALLTTTSTANYNNTTANTTATADTTANTTNTINTANTIATAADTTVDTATLDLPTSTESSTSASTSSIPTTNVNTTTLTKKRQLPLYRPPAAGAPKPLAPLPDNYNSNTEGSEASLAAALTKYNKPKPTHTSTITNIFKHQSLTEASPSTHNTNININSPTNSPSTHNMNTRTRSRSSGSSSSAIATSTTHSSCSGTSTISLDVHRTSTSPLTPICMATATAPTTAQTTRTHVHNIAIAPSSPPIVSRVTTRSMLHNTTVGSTSSSPASSSHSPAHDQLQSPPHHHGQTCSTESRTVGQSNKRKAPAASAESPAQPNNKRPDRSNPSSRPSSFSTTSTSTLTPSSSSSSSSSSQSPNIQPQTQIDLTLSPSPPSLTTATTAVNSTSSLSNTNSTNTSSNSPSLSSHISPSRSASVVSYSSENTTCNKP